MPSTITPNMNLVVPTVGSQPGPTYATNINSSLMTIDGHDHTTGNGVPITPAGININASLVMNNQRLTDIGALTLQVQSVDAASGSIYEKGVDLYYRDGNGNVIRITQAGSVAGSSGTITGLPSGTASASFASSTFVFQAATNTAATIDGASFILRNSTANSFGLTLQPPNAMGANYTLTLPSIPSSQKIMTLDNAGNISAPYVVDNSTIEVSSNTIQVKDSGITQQKLAVRPIAQNTVGGVGVSGSCGTFANSNTSFVSITNLNVTVTTSAAQRPVRLSITSDATLSAGLGSFVSCSNSASVGTVTVQIIDNSSNVIGAWTLQGNSGVFFPTNFETYDYSPGSGKNYVAQIKGSGPSWTVLNAKLVGYEI